MSIFPTQVYPHAACPRPCCMFMSVLHVNVHAAAHVHAACLNVTVHVHVNVHVARLIVNVHSVCPCPCPCCIPMSMLHVYALAAWPCPFRRHGHSTEMGTDSDMERDIDEWNEYLREALPVPTNTQIYQISDINIARNVSPISEIISDWLPFSTPDLGISPISE